MICFASYCLYFDGDFWCIFFFLQIFHEYSHWSIFNTFSVSFGWLTGFGIIAMENYVWLFQCIKVKIYVDSATVDDGFSLRIKTFSSKINRTILWMLKIWLFLSVQWTIFFFKFVIRKKRCLFILLRRTLFYICFSFEIVFCLITFFFFTSSTLLLHQFSNTDHLSSYFLSIKSNLHFYHLPKEKRRYFC